MSRESLSHAIIEVTPHCNLRCRHCYNFWKADGWEEPYRKTYLKTFRLIDHLIKHTTVRRMVFTGGEPTISERFTELVLHARIHRKKVTIITNGCGPAKVYDQLREMQVSLMEFSIHSSQAEVHDRITGIPGSWQKAVGQMKQMIDHGIPVAPVTVITAFNHSGIRETLQFFQDLGIDTVMLNRYNIGGNGLTQERQLSATLTELRNAFREANEFAAHHPLQIVSGVCTPHCILDPEDYPEIPFGSCSANYLERPLTFDPDGNVRLCNHSPIIAGNIYRQPFSSIFTTPYTDEWKKLDLPFCTSCIRLPQCKGGCRAASEQLGQSLTHADPIITGLGGKPF